MDPLCCYIRVYLKISSDFSHSKKVKGDDPFTCFASVK